MLGTLRKVAMYLVLLVGEKTDLLGPGFSKSGLMGEGVSRDFWQPHPLVGK